MRVITPITDMTLSISSLLRQGDKLVLHNAESDAMPATAVLDRRDMNTLVKAMLRPSLLWFAVTSLFPGASGQSADPEKNTTATPEHPSPHPW